MLERGKLVTSFRAAAIVAGVVILAPFCTFADSVPTALENQIELSAAANPLTFVEGGKAKDFILTVKNISNPAQKIGIKSINITAILTDGTDRSDTILPLPKPSSNCPATCLVPAPTRWRTSILVDHRAVQCCRNAGPPGQL
jgi:hypothetical protein